MYHHRSGTLKQSNKSHKAGHASKRALDKGSHGRVEGGGGSEVASSISKKSIKSISHMSEVGKADRANRAKQIKDQKKAEEQLLKRLGGSGGFGPSKVVAVVGLGPNANPHGVAAQLLSLADSAYLPASGNDIGNPLLLSYNTFRQRLLVACPPRGGTVQQVPSPSGGFTNIPLDVTQTLAAVRGADILLLVVSSADYDPSLEKPASTATGGAGAAASAAPVAGGAAGGAGAPSSSSSAPSEPVKISAAAASKGLIDEEGELFLACLKATGVPTILGVAQAPSLAAAGSKTFPDFRRYASRLFQTDFGEDTKVVEACVDPLSNSVASYRELVERASGAAAAAAGASKASSHHLQSLQATVPSFNAALKSGAVSLPANLYSPLAINTSAPGIAAGSAAAAELAALAAAQASIKGLDTLVRDANSATLQLVRAVTSLASSTGSGRKVIHWRANRSYLVAEDILFTPQGEGQAAAGSAAGAAGVTTSSSSPVTGTLSVSGYLKGRPLNVHQLINLPSGGVYQIKRILKAADPARQLATVNGTSKGRPVAGAGAAGAAATTLSALPGLDFGLYSGAAGQQFVSLAAALLPVGGKVTVGSGKIAMPAEAAAAAPSASSPSAASAVVLASSEPELCEPLDNLAAPEGAAEEGEQTWPTEEEERAHSRKRKGGAAAAAGGEEEEDMGGSDGSGDEEDEDEDDELRAAGRGAGKGSKKTKRPLGMSATQAAWLPSDDEDSDYEEVDEEDEKLLGGDQTLAWNRKHGPAESRAKAEEALKERKERLEMKTAGEQESRARLKERSRRRKMKRMNGAAAEDDDDEDEESETEGGAAAEDEDGSMGSLDEEDDTAGPLPAGLSSRQARAAAAAAANERARRQAEAEEYRMFPDEIDTPVDQPARERFGRYRGLKSFRTSPWDPKESLPPAYARIYSLPSFQQTQERVLLESELAEKALLSLEARKLQVEGLRKREEQDGKQAKALASRKAASGTDSAAGSMAGSVRKGSVAGASSLADGESLMGLEEGEGSSDSDAEEVEGMEAEAGMEEESASKGKATKTAAAAATAAAAKAGKRQRHTDALVAALAEGKTIELQDLLGPGWVSSGQYLTIELSSVPQEALQECLAPGVPLTLFSLLRHENRASVMHYVCNRTNTSAEPLKSRDQLELHIGNRVLDSRPVFSEHLLRGDRARMERYWLPGRSVTLSAYAPVTYSPMPVLVFKRVPVLGSPAALAVAPTAAAASTVLTEAPLTEAQIQEATKKAGLYPAPDRVNRVTAGVQGFKLELLGTGHCLGANPDRLALKRTILTGFPVKVHKKKTVAQYMFFTPEDVQYWMSVELHTKMGLSGCIKESVGTHGRMKCAFDKPLRQDDSILMPLYKRVFPHWGDCFSRASEADLHAKALAEFRKGYSHEGEAETEML